MEFFELFNLQPSLEIDEKALKKMYYKKSREVHPDFFTLEDADTQESKLSEATILNAAFNTLSDRQQRIEYILNQKEMLEEGKNEVPQAFLFEVMDINELIAELKMDFDSSNEAKAEAMISELEQKLEDDYQDILSQFGQAQKFTESILKGLKDYFLKHRYLLRMQDNLKESN